MPASIFSRSTLSALTLLAVFSAVGAEAQSISYTISIPVQNTDWITTASFPQFDVSLGTLQSIDLSLTGTVETNYVFDNHRGGSQDITIYTQGQITLDGPAAPALLQVTPQQSDTFHLEPEDVYSNTLDVIDSINTQLSQSADLSPFIGVGDLALSIYASNTSYSSTTTYFTSIVPFAGATVNMTYNYNGVSAVPEPCTLMLLTSAAGVIFLRLRKR